MHGCCGKRKHELRKIMLKRYNKNKPIGTWYRKDKEKLKNCYMKYLQREYDATVVKPSERDF